MTERWTHANVSLASAYAFSPSTPTVSRLLALLPSPTVGETRVRAWLGLDLFASHDRSRPEQRKRQRDSDSGSDHPQHIRHASPKQRNGDDDDIVRGQSVPHAGSVIELNERTTLSSISAGSKRSARPKRQKTLLRNVRPPILRENPLIPVPVDVAPRLRALLQGLSRRLTSQFITACLRAILGKEPAFQNALVHEPIDDDAYNESDERLAERKRPPWRLSTKSCDFPTTGVAMHL
ncbi:hypothetical protein BDV95DRAFT_605540 [Massariosphaeria phaeospora]|uniref:Uncharacterized protein n=1 Tax=Massariosphaeria phaeospora TaxID=100035 RepID=A0A7C8MC58_9PLEO|nr:hypothetical protein BDV95DRAFT_605540 [Massariosphaeria phaeospora]